MAAPCPCPCCDELVDERECVTLPCLHVLCQRCLNDVRDDEVGCCTMRMVEGLPCNAPFTRVSAAPYRPVTPPPPTPASAPAPTPVATSSGRKRMGFVSWTKGKKQPVVVDNAQTKALREPPKKPTIDDNPQTKTLREERLPEVEIAIERSTHTLALLAKYAADTNVCIDQQIEYLKDKKQEVLMGLAATSKVVQIERDELLVAREHMQLALTEPPTPQRIARIDKLAAPAYRLPLYSLAYTTPRIEIQQSILRPVLLPNHCYQAVNSLERTFGNVPDFRNPVDIKLLPDGNLVVSDRDNNRLQVFTTAGMHVKTIALQHPPRYLAVTPQGDIWVAHSTGIGLYSYATGALLKTYLCDIPTGMVAIPDGTLAIACRSRRRPRVPPPADVPAEQPMEVDQPPPTPPAAGPAPDAQADESDDESDHDSGEDDAPGDNVIDDTEVVVKLLNQRATKVRWQSHGVGFNAIEGMTYADDMIVVCDSGSNRLQALTPATGETLYCINGGSFTKGPQLQAADIPNRRNPDFLKPCFVAFDPLRRVLLVSDTIGVSVWTLDGVLVHAWSTQRAVGGICVSNTGAVFMCNPLMHRVEVYMPAGSY